MELNVEEFIERRTDALLSLLRVDPNFRASAKMIELIGKHLELVHDHGTMVGRNSEANWWLERMKQVTKTEEDDRNED